MGAVIALPLIAIALVSFAFAVWSLYVVVLEGLTFARAVRRHGSGETAAHYEPGNHRQVSTHPFGSAPADRS